MRFRHISDWLAVLFFFHFLWLVYCVLFNGTNTYMGGENEALMQTGLDLYRMALGKTFVKMLGINLVIGLLLLWPTIFLRRNGRNTFWVLSLLGFFILIQGLWISIGIIRIPTLFSEIYETAEGGFFTFVFHSLATRHGPLVLGLILALAGGSLYFFMNRIRFIITICYYVSAGLALFISQQPLSDLPLPDKSVLLLMADSLRSDAIDPVRTPEIWRQFSSDPSAWMLREAVPPVARTTPAVTALLTGKLPMVSKVRDMFSQESSFDQRTGSIVSRYREAGYCTIAVGEYPADFFNKIDFGFDAMDVPLIRFRELILQGMVKRSGLLLATLTWDVFRESSLLNKELRTLFIGLPTFAAGNSLLKRLAVQAKICDSKPIFAFMFFDQPHFPYVQTWPHYLALDPAYDGPFRFMKDAVSEPRNEIDRQRVRDLYQASVRAMDHSVGKILVALENAKAREGRTVIITGDHGESLYDRVGIMGHGDQLAEWEGITIPWLVFGAPKIKLEEVANRKFSTLHLAEWLAAIRGLPYLHTSLTLDEIYVESEIWMAESPNLPKDRIRYPDLSAILGMKDPDAHIAVKDEYLPLINHAKHRKYIFESYEISFYPSADHVKITSNGVNIVPPELPPRARIFFEKYDPSFYRSLF